MIETAIEIGNELCKCGHARKLHHHGRSCTAIGRSIKFCNCEQFRPDAISETPNTNPIESISEEKSMRKSKKEMAKAPKKASANGLGRKPVLAPFLDNPLPLYATYKGKEYTAVALTSGFIKLKEQEYPTPSAAARAILGNNEKGKPLQVDGWHFWKFNKDGERMSLSGLRSQKDIKRRSKQKAEAAD